MVIELCTSFKTSCPVYHSFERAQRFQEIDHWQSPDDDQELELIEWSVRIQNACNGCERLDSKYIWSACSTLCHPKDKSNVLRLENNKKGDHYAMWINCMCQVHIGWLNVRNIRGYFMEYCQSHRHCYGSV